MSAQISQSQKEIPMIVFISDLHFRDEKEWTVSLRATKGFIEQNLIPQIRDAKAKEVTIVFLGDIVDINRSPFWIDGHSGIYKPWSHWQATLREKKLGNVSPNQPFEHDDFEKHILKVLDQIEETNRGNYRLWRRFKKLDKRMWGDEHMPDKITFEFVPGNHDRLSQYSPATQSRLIKHLCLDQDATSVFPWVKYDEPHNVLALHGHVFTGTDFGGRSHQPDEFDSSPWYMLPSLGDVATLMFGVKLYHDIKGHEHLRDLLAEIDLVRPEGEIFRWILSKVKGNPEDEKRIDTIVARLAREFVKDPFVRWRLKWWEMLLARLILFLGLPKNITRAGWLFRLLGFGRESKEKYTKEMLKMITKGKFREWLDRRYGDQQPNIVSGHTHHPLVVPVQGDKEGDPSAAVHYFNTGTWLDTIEKDCATGYARRHQITHATFYKDGEEVKRDGKRSYWEYWDGCLK
jgi:UDP-2,3-diacylglucosamine pyrophosphatase LpxH